MAIHADHKVMVPPKNPGGASDINSGVECHLALGDIGNKARGVLSELESLEARGESKKLTGTRWL